MNYLLAFIQVVDWKIIDGGRQLYKVEWHATWEPAEALATCQHLVDEFWTLVNKTKQNEVTCLKLLIRGSTGSCRLDVALPCLTLNPLDIYIVRFVLYSTVFLLMLGSI